jgi:hypothetical protein
MRIILSKLNTTSEIKAYKKIILRPGIVVLTPI